MSTSTEKSVEAGLTTAGAIALAVANPGALAALAAANAALALIETLQPTLQELFRNDPVLAAEQAANRAKFDALRDHAKFTGPEWERSTAKPAEDGAARPSLPPAS